MAGILRAYLLLLILPAPLGLVIAREPGATDPEGQKCDSPIYTSKEVSRRAKLTHIPLPETTEEFRARRPSGRAVLTAVMCETGRVTDVTIIEGVPYGMDERLIEAVRGVKFTPAEKDGQAASQRLRIEFKFNTY